MADFPFAWATRTYVMGALNATPDSFSGDGVPDDADRLAARGMQMARDGAHLVDIGGESTRPGYRDVPAAEEAKRVIPAVRAAARVLPVPVSIDTRKATVAQGAIEAGASIINDVSGLSDPDLAPVAAGAGAMLILVHPVHSEPSKGIVDCVVRDLARLAESAIRAGVAQERLIVDPGLGFGKGWRENFAILRDLSRLRDLGFPILVGPSRKGMIGKVLGVPPHDRVEGTIALVSLAIAGGADMVRVHDVRENARAAAMMDAVVRVQGE